MRKNANPEAGFTIVELMIATIVFSVILLISTYGIINIGRLYRKSLNSNQTQQAARSIIDTVAQNIKFTNGGFYDSISNSSDGISYYCLGYNVRLTYVLNKQILNGNHAMILDKTDCSQSSGPKDFTSLGTGDRELLGPRMRLAKFLICYEGSSNADCDGISINKPDLYYVSVRVVYGDDDLLTSSGPQQNCLTKAGREFCAVSELSTYVQKVL